MGDRVFVAGAGGAIGRVLCRLLVADGWDVVGTTRKPEVASALRAQGVEPAVVDVLDAAALRAEVARAAPSAVIHQLTDLPRTFDPAALRAALERNAVLREVGTRNLVEASMVAGVRTLVAQSIAFAYAPGPTPVSEDAPLDVDAADPLAARTARAVRTLEQLVLGGPFRGVVLRYGRLYGPGTWSATPSSLGCVVHVDAAADAARRALTDGDAGVYHVAEPDGSVTVDRARHLLHWNPAFRSPGDGDFRGGIG